jgi:quinol monooxygenase YgiN
MRFSRIPHTRTAICLCVLSIATIGIVSSFFFAVAQGTRSSTVQAASRRSAETPTSQAPAAGRNDIFHVAIFRFPKEHLNDAMAAFQALASATRREPGNLSYDVYRGIEDDQEFYIVEHWASPSALAAHERTEAFIHYGQGVLVKSATLHDTVTARPFEVR